MDFTIKRLDHLGIIAGVMQDLKIAEKIDKQLEPDKQVCVTPGEAVVSMILNGLGFSNRVTTLTPQFFSNKPMELLIGKNINEEQLNRHKLGRTLDAIAAYGCEKLFNQIALDVCSAEEIDLRKTHSDTTTFSVEGGYEGQLEDAEVHITHGYSKAHRPDLKQLILELAVSSDGNIPFIMKPWSGNASDNHIFGERVKALQQAAEDSHTGRTMIADSKLYTQKNMEMFCALRFITRVPATIQEEKNYIATSLHDNVWTDLNNDYKIRPFNVNHYGIEQRWIVIHSQQARDRATKTLDKTQQKEAEYLKKNLFHLQAKRFNCHETAEKALAVVAKQYRFYRIIDQEISSLGYYEKAGRPTADSEKKIAYQVTATFEIDTTALLQEIDRRSCFVLATNIPENELASADVLKEYKGQDCVEKSFAFLKAPSFFAASFFLKSVTRIQAMLVVMTLALLMYTVAQRRLRTWLSTNKKTIPNQIKKPTDRPTLHWAFQILEGIDFVKIYAVAGPVQAVIQGLNDLRKLILSAFGESVMKIYRIIDPNLGET